MFGVLSKPRLLNPLFLATFICLSIVILRQLLLSVNFPFSDDYNTILEFILKFRNADFSDKIQLLFAQHNEHRLFWNRLVVLTDFYLFGSVNFQRLILYGNLGWIFLWFLLLPELKKTTVSSIVPFLALFLSLSFYETLFWATAAIQNLWVIFWTTAGFKALISKSIRFRIIGVLCITISSFTAASGVLSIPVGCFLLLYKANFSRRNLLLCAGLILVMLIYFIGYVSPAHHTSLQVNLFGNPMRTIAYFFGYLGSPILPLCGYRDWFLIPVGVLTALLSLYSLPLLLVKNRLLFSLVLYSLLSIMALTAGRSMMDAPGSIVSRYMVMPVFFWMSLSLVIPELMQIHLRPIMNRSLVLLSFLFLIADYFKNSDIVVREKKLRLEGQACYCKCQHPFGLLFPHLPEAERIIENSLYAGVFVPCREIKEKCKGSVVKNNEYFQWKIEESSLSEDNLQLRGWAFYPGANSKDSQVEIVLLTFQHILKIVPQKKIEPLVGLFSGNEKNSYSGFEWCMPTDLLPKIRKSYLIVRWCGDYTIIREFYLSKH